MDGTDNQVSPLDLLVGAEHVSSYDLKSATDGWPINLQGDILAFLFGSEVEGFVTSMLSLS